MPSSPHNQYLYDRYEEEGGCYELVPALRARYGRREGGREGEGNVYSACPGWGGEGEIFDVNLTESSGGTGYLLFCIHHAECRGYYTVQYGL